MRACILITYVLIGRALSGAILLFLRQLRVAADPAARCAVCHREARRPAWRVRRTRRHRRRHAGKRTLVDAAALAGLLVVSCIWQASCCNWVLNSRIARWSVRAIERMCSFFMRQLVHLVLQHHNCCCSYMLDVCYCFRWKSTTTCTCICHICWLYTQCIRRLRPLNMS